MLVQANVPVLNEGWTVEYFDKTIRDLQAASAFVDNEPHPAPRLIVWPESPAPFYVPDPKFHHALAEVATSQQAYVLAGSLGVDRAEGKDADSALLNSAILVKPDATTRSTWYLSANMFRSSVSLALPAKSLKTLEISLPAASGQYSTLMATKWVSSSATNPYFPTRSASSRNAARKSWSTFPMTAGMAKAARPGST
jgi:hypothetical protein